MEGWAEFSQNVSGEWEGHGADFSKEGAPVQLPESAIPEAYKEWGVKVFDWQTQCPTLALPVPQYHFSYKLIRLFPAVGCEVDAPPTYSVLERSVDATSSSRVLELEHCLVNPRAGESRVRIIQKVRVYDEQGLRMQLEAMQVFCENRKSPARNGDKRSVCALGNSAFASSSALQPSRISGLWHHIHHANATFHTDMAADMKELVEDEAGAPMSCSRDGNSEIFLPNQLWCLLNHEHAGETWFQVGWLLDGGLAITSKCIFSSNAILKGITITHEKPQT